MNVWRRIKDFGPGGRARKERDLEREIQDHLTLEAEESGRYGARRAFGNILTVKENVREAWGWTRLEQFARDAGYGLRQVRRNPLFSGIAIATLALGIGGITAMFSAFDAVLIRPMPYADADRLVMIWDDMSGNDVTTKHNSTPAEWIEWRRLNTVFTDLATSQPGDATLSGDGEPEQLPARKVTWTFWSVLGVQPKLGRVFTEDEDNKGVRVVVISHGLWQRRFGGSPDIVGRKISLNDEPYEVIGVMPQGFYFMPSRDIDIWMPASFPAWMRRNFTWHDAQIVARLKPGVTLEQRKTVHGGIEFAGDSEGFPRSPFGDRHASAGRDRGQNTNRADPAAVRVGGAAVDRVRQSGESPAFAERGARPGSCGAHGAWRGSRKAGRAIPYREPGACRVRYACRTRSRPSRHAIS